MPKESKDSSLKQILHEIDEIMGKFKPDKDKKKYLQKVDGEDNLYQLTRGLESKMLPAALDKLDELNSLVTKDR